MRIFYGIKTLGQATCFHILDSEYITSSFHIHLWKLSHRILSSDMLDFLNPTRHDYSVTFFLTQVRKLSIKKTRI
jgi:hypothetical protein